MSNTTLPSLQWNLFTYDPLPTSTSFRLLSVAPTESTDPNVTICGRPLITCFLETVDLEKHPAYDALSYTWGNPHIYTEKSYGPTHKWPISVNGQLFLVTRNLYEGLQQLQRQNLAGDGVNKRYEPHGKTALIEAAESGDTDEIRRLVDEGALIQLQDNYGETALHYAAENGYPEAVEFLLQSGASMSTLDLAGRTPLACCLQRLRRQWLDVWRILANHDDNSMGNIEIRELCGFTSIWIDAICIDQDNIAERNAQVAMMSQIYSEAVRVVVWLGVEDFLTAQVAKFMAGLTGYDDWRMLELPPWGGFKGHEQVAMMSFVHNRTWFQRKWVAQEVILADKVDMFCAMAQSENLIEPHLLPRTMAVKHGRVGSAPSASGDTLAFLRLACDLKKAKAVLSRRPTRVMSTEFQTRGKSATLWLPRLRRPTLSQLIIMSWNLSTTDPRDKVFALMGLVEATDAKGSISVDYNKTTCQVFLEMGRTMINTKADSPPGVCHSECVRHQGELELLEGLSFVQPAFCARYHSQYGRKPCQRASRLPGLPTWVPRFDQELVNMRFHEPCFNASGTLSYRAHVSDPTLLRLEGLMVDTVTMVEGALLTLKQSEFEFKFGEHTWSTWVGHPHEIGKRYSVRSWLAMAIAMDPVYFTGQDRAEVLWRTLIADRAGVACHTRGPDPERNDAAVLRESFKRFVSDERKSTYSEDEFDETVYEILDALRHTDQSSSLPSESDMERYDAENCVTPEPVDHSEHTGHFEDCQHCRYCQTCQQSQKCSFCQECMKPEGRKPINDFAQRLALYVYTRALFLTERGYLGNGFNTALPGDQVWILAGARVPYLLREVPRTGRFELVGEAYVHGLMHGEALADGAAERFRPIEIQ